MPRDTFPRIVCRVPTVLACCAAMLAAAGGPQCFPLETAPAADLPAVFAEHGVHGGFVVQVGIPARPLELVPTESFHAQVLDRHADRVAALRQTLVAEGRYGRLSVEHRTGGDLPYVDGIVNLLIVEEPASPAEPGVTEAEALRVLVPEGIALFRTADGGWRKVVKPRDPGLAEWTHYLHDATGNAVAPDEVVGPPRHLQWVGSPRYSRHHDRMASMSGLVSTGGRVFYIMDEGSRISILLPPQWKLIARDAFNGTVLWKRDIADWQSHLWPLKSGPTQLARRLVAVRGTDGGGDRVYVTLGYDAPLTALDAATGATVATYEGTAAAEEVITTGGLLFVVSRKAAAELADYTPLNPTVGDQAAARELFWNEAPRVVTAIDAASGRTLWSTQTRISPLTLAAGPTASGGRVYFHDGERIVALDQQSGAVAWTSEPVTRRNQFTFNFGPRLVVHDDVVLYAGGDGAMVAVNAADGHHLWDATHPNSGYQSPQDLMVVQGLVWSAPLTSGNDSGVFSGRDLRTGEVKVEFPPNVDTYWFHHRCYISKATDRFIIPSRTGVEFVDPTRKDWEIHHWVRGGCLYGVMPCNGLTYTPPHDCACYPEAKLFGFNALAARAPTRPLPQDVPEAGRLERGPAWDRPLADATAEGPDDWPTFRHDRERTGGGTQAAATGFGTAWDTSLGGRLSAPVIAGGRVYVAQIDAHTLHALDEATGGTRWSFTAGGRIDSPPTVRRGRVVFGSADGHVYCLDAADGALAWRYRAAPLDRRTMAYEQLESLWPVHGSVLILDDDIYCVAGRSNFLDGGLRLLRLRLADGGKVAERILDDTDPDTGGNLQDKLKILQMPVGLPDVLSADAERIYMKSQVFDHDFNRQAIGPNAGDFVGQASVQRGVEEHLFAPFGFLDDSWFHRGYWVYGRSFAGGHGGYYQAARFAPAGQIMVKGDGYVFGYGRKPQYLRWTTTMEHQLFAAVPSPPEIPEGFATGGGKKGKKDAPARVVFPRTPSLDPAGKPLTIEAWMTATKPDGVIVSHGGPLEGFALWLDGGRPVFSVRSAGGLTEIRGEKRIVGGWHHVCGVLEPDHRMRLFIDGTPVATGEATGLLTKPPQQPFEIGCDSGTAVGSYQSPAQFTGLVDEVRLYFAAVTDDQVTARVARGDEMHPDPRLVVTADDGSARDFSAFLNNGTVEGAGTAEGRFGNAFSFTARNAGRQQPVRQGESLVEPKWTADLPIYVRAMAQAGGQVYVAGPLDLMDEEDAFARISARDPEIDALLRLQDDALEGRIGGRLLVVDAQSGDVVRSEDLGTLPAWDGLATANGRLFLTTTDGRVRCYGK